MTDTNETETEQQHPDAETLARYTRGELSRDESRELERHLMTCIDCQSQVDQTASAGVQWKAHRFGKNLKKTRKAQEEQARRDQAEEERRDQLRGVIRSLSSIIGNLGEQEARELLAESQVGRRKLLQRQDRFHTAHLCELLLERCRRAWLEQPDAAVELAKLAALIAGRLSFEHYGARQVRNLKSMAWMHVGNSFRVARAADIAVAEDGEEWETGEMEEEEYPEIETPEYAVAEPSGDTPEVSPKATAEAEAAFFEVRDLFLERGMGFDAALVTMELAAVYQRQGHGDFIPSLAAEAIPLFEQAEERGVPSYTTDALRFLRDTAAAGKLTPEGLTKMHTLLQRRRNDPEFRFKDKEKAP
ncbi:MAG TPA: hypothetical protein VEL74_22190 [Thermoanaerobaculia bacterium]|nr:hypothetical protein [Thermoanaerobaculia bacterium]